MIYQKRYYKTTILLILLLGLIGSCTPQETQNSTHNNNVYDHNSHQEQPIPSQTIKIEKPIQKLKVSALYPKENRNLLKQINTKKQKQLNTPFYHQDQFLNHTIYVKRSPYEIFNTIKNQKELSNNDSLLLLRYALEFNKIDQLDLILPRFATASVTTAQTLQAAKLLFQFDHVERSYTLLEKSLTDTLNNKGIEEHLFTNHFTQLLNQLTQVKKHRLKKFDRTPYLLKGHQKFPENITLLSSYINHLIDLKQYAKAVTILTPYLKRDLKVLPLFEKLYQKSGQTDELIALYEKTLKLPKHRALFNNYLTLLKTENKLQKKRNTLTAAFNKEKTLKNYYPLYFVYQYKNNTKAVKTLMNRYQKALDQNPNNNGLYALGEQYYQQRSYTDSYNLINALLLNKPTGKNLDRSAVLMLNILKNRPHVKTVFKQILPFNHPDLITGLLSLYQNSFHKTDLVKGLSETVHAYDACRDIEYIYNTFEKQIKDPEQYRHFTLAYFSFLKQLQDHQSKKELITLALKIQKETKDLELKLAILRDRTIQKSIHKKQILSLYESLMVQHKNDDQKFKQLLNENLSFVRAHYKSRELVNIIYRYLDQFPKKEMLYSRLLTVLNRYRFYQEEIEVYQRAMKQFNRKTWSAKFARFLLNRKFYNEIKSLNKNLAQTEEMTQFVSYMTKTFRKRYGKYRQKHNLFFEDIFIDALKKYPYNQKLVKQLLQFYRSFGKYYDKSLTARRKYEALLVKYMFIFPELRTDYYRLKQKKSKNALALENKLQQLFKIKVKTLPEHIFFAEGLLFMNRFEDAVAPYNLITTYYNTDQKLLEDGAHLLKSLASSFYINDPSYLNKALLYFKRLTYLDQLNPQHYINLAELYYERNQPIEATQTLYRGIMGQQDDAATFKAIANMFYDYYDYDNALKVLHQFRKNNQNPHAFHPLIGRLLELKNKEKDALAEYIADIYHQPLHAYQSQKRLKALYHKESLKQNVIKMLLKNEGELFKNSPLFETVTTLLLTLNEKTAAIDLYQKSIVRSKKEAILSATARFFDKAQNSKRAEQTLLQLLKRFPEDRNYERIITFYQQEKQFDQIWDQYHSWLKQCPLLTDHYNHIKIFTKYLSLLKSQKEYGKIITLIQQKTGDKNLEKQSQIPLYLELLQVYQLDNRQKKIVTLINKLNQKFPESSTVIAATFKFYREQKQQKQLTTYLKKLLKETDKSKSLNYYQKRSRIANYRKMLIEEMKLAGDHVGVQVQFIEILNKNPRDLDTLKTAYYHAQNHKLKNRIEKFYLKTTAVSSRDHRFMLLMGHFYKLDQQYEKAITFFEKAFKLEPQNSSIGTELIKMHELAGHYKIVYTFYLKRYEQTLKQTNNSYHLNKYLDKLLEMALKLNDQEKINLHLVAIAGKPNGFQDQIKYHRIQFAAQMLAHHNEIELAQKYYEKYLYKVMKGNQYISQSTFQSYFNLLLQRGDINAALEKIFEYYGLIDTYYTSKYSRYKKRSCRTALLGIIRNYLPKQKHQLTRIQFQQIETYLKKKSVTAHKQLLQAIAQFFKDSGKLDLYFATIKKYKKARYYRSEFFSFLRSHFQFKTLVQKLSTNNQWELKEKTTLSNIFGSKNDSVIFLEKMFHYGCPKTKHRFHGNPITLYLNYQQKHNPNNYAKLAQQKCHYSEIKTHFLKQKEKGFALKLIDNNKSGSNAIIEKIAIYEGLKEYSQEGMALFQELLKPDAVITTQLNPSDQSPSIWNQYIMRYARYLGAGKLKNPLPYLINTLEVNPGSQRAYTSIGHIFEDLKQYQNALTFYLYADQLHSNTKTKINLMRVYFKQDQQKQFKNLKEQLLKSKNISSYSALYVALKEIKQLDIQFIDRYKDRLITATNQYGYHRLGVFYNQLIEYFVAQKNIDRLLTMVATIKQDIRLPLYQNLLYNNTLSLKEHRQVLEQLINHYQQNKDHYNLNRHARIKFELQFKEKEYEQATMTLTTYGPLFDKMERGVTEYLMLRLNYAQKRIEPVVDYGVKYAFQSILPQESDSYQYHDQYRGRNYDHQYEQVIFNNSLQKLLTLVASNQSTFGKQSIKQLYAQIKTAPISLYQQLAILPYLDRKELKQGISNLMDRYTINEIQQLQPLMIKYNLSTLLTLLVDRQFNNFYLHQTPQQLANALVNFTLNRLIKGDITGLVKQLKITPLSERNLKALHQQLVKFPEELSRKILSTLPKTEEDLQFIAAILAINIKQNDDALAGLLALKGLKFDLLKNEMIATLYYNKGSFNHEALFYDVLNHNSYHIYSKRGLIQYYIQSKQPQKALFILAKMGLNNYVAFNEIVSGTLDSEGSYGPYQSSYHYYGYNTIESMVQRIIGSNDSKKHSGLKTFLKKYIPEEEQKELLTFLQAQYQQYPSRNFGLNILKAQDDVEGYQKLLNQKK